MTTVAVVGEHPWCREAFDTYDTGQWTYLEHIDYVTLEDLDPRWVFFLHWPHIVPPEITARWRCVGFHMTDLPEGRGGSPLQHLILAGKTETVLTAFTMTDELDAGPIWCKAPLTLEGRAQDIYLRASLLAMHMAVGIVQGNGGRNPRAQEGEATYTKRRTYEESEIPKGLTSGELYDFVRMLDAEGYPRAWIDFGDFRVYFTDAHLEGGTVRMEALAG